MSRKEDDQSRTPVTMAPRSRDEIMVRDSIEAKIDEDVDMEDAPPPKNGGIEVATADAHTSAQTTGESEADADADADADPDGEADADGDAEEADEDGAAETSVGRPGRRRGPDTPHRRLLQLIDTTSKYLCDYEEK